MYTIMQGFLIYLLIYTSTVSNNDSLFILFTSTVCNDMGDVLNPKELKALRENFLELDKDKNGKISIN